MKDGLAPEHCDGRSRHKSERSGRGRLRSDVLAQRAPDASARGAGRAPAVRLSPASFPAERLRGFRRRSPTLPAATRPAGSPANCRSHLAAHSPATRLGAGGAISHFRCQVGGHFHTRADFANFRSCPCHGRYPQVRPIHVLRQPFPRTETNGRAAKKCSIAVALVKAFNATAQKSTTPRTGLNAVFSGRLCSSCALSESQIDGDSIAV